MTFFHPHFGGWALGGPCPLDNASTQFFLGSKSWQLVRVMAKGHLNSQAILVLARGGNKVASEAKFSPAGGEVCSFALNPPTHPI